MKNKSAFTVIELVILLVICTLVFILIYGVATSHKNSHDAINPWIFPEQAMAKAQQELADQMRIQNELLRRQLELKEHKGE